MKLTSVTRQTLLNVILILTLSATGLTYYLDREQTSTIDHSVVPSIKSNEVNLEQRQSTPSHSTSQRTFHHATKDIFAAFTTPKAQQPASAEQSHNLPIAEQKIKTVILSNPPAQPSSPTQPTAPPIPFKYIGKLYGDEEYIVFLNMYGKNISVKTGDTIAQSYKVDEINPPLMTATYIPLNLKQTIDIGAP